MSQKLAINGGEPVRKEPFPKYPYYKENVKESLIRVFESQHYCGLGGTEVGRFEEAFAKHFGSKCAVGSSNGTTSLQLALAAVGVGSGDEVILPAYTFIATASAVIDRHAIPVLVDSEETSYGMDPDEVERKITPATKAIMPVHINGYPCDMERIMEIAKKHNLKVVEDCSHAHGAVHNGRKVGTIGDIGVFSLQGKKNMSCGEGGVAVTDNEEAAKLMKQMLSFGPVPMKYNYRMSEFHAAIAYETLKDLDWMNSVRQENASYLKPELNKLDGITVLEGLPNTEAVYYNCMLRYDKDAVGLERSDYVKALQAEGVPINLFYYPLNRDSIFQARDAFGHGRPFTDPLNKNEVTYSMDDNPIASKLMDEVNIELKVHPPQTIEDMKDVVAAFNKVHENLDELKASVEANKTAGV